MISAGKRAHWDVITTPAKLQKIVAIPSLIRHKGKGRPGARYRLVNFSKDNPIICVGDRIQLEPRDIGKLKIRGPAAIVPQKGIYILYFYGPGRLKIAVKGKPRTKIVIPVEAAALPPETGGAIGLLGPLQPQLAFPDSEVLHPYDRFIFALDLVIESGCNFFSLSPLSYWNNSGSIAYQYLPPAPFVRVNGRYDLTKIDPLYRKVLTCMFWRAARAGITVDWYLLDHVSFTHPWMWDKHPLNAKNNIHGWITAEGCPCGYNKDWVHNVTHKYEAVPKGCGSAEMRAVFTAMLRSLAGLVPKELRSRVRVGPGIETESRTFDWWVVTQIIKPLGLRAISNLKDWYGDQAYEDGWMPGIIDSDQRWQELAGAVDVISLHGCDSHGETRRRFERLIVHAKRYGFHLMASTDGAGLKSAARRPEGDRPSIDDLVQAYSEGESVARGLFSGLEFKHLGLADLEEISPALARRLWVGK